MTRSTITRERLGCIASWRAKYSSGHNVVLPAEEAEELARIALAAMDSEPVAEVYQVPNVGICAALGPSIRMLCPLEPGTKLYRHAQPVPVVLKDHQIRELVNQLRDIAIEYHGTQQLRERIARVLRAAMLQAEPVTTANKLGNSPVIPDCWCRTCRPVVLNDMRFVVCPDCGNKRCPRANDHRNSCTWSNVPGQEGSAYPAAPQEVKP